MKWKTQRVRALKSLAGAMSLTGAAWAQAPDQLTISNPEAWEVQSVRELMQWDIERALDQARRRTDPPDAAMDATGGRLAPRLVAMYGVGRTLMAEVLVGARPYLYMRGQAYPVGHANDQTLYQLRGMNGSCIQLHKAQTSHSLCLHALLGARQP